jgi:hypothetical protein
MDRDKFYSLVNWDEPSGWLEDAKRRERWSWLRRIILRPHIKYLRLRRAFLLFLHGVIGRFYCNPIAILMVVYALILITMLLILAHPFIEYYTGYSILPIFYN